MYNHTTADNLRSQDTIGRTDLTHILQQAVQLASGGRLSDTERARLWKLAADGDLEEKTAQGLIEFDTATRAAHESKPRRKRKKPSRRTSVRQRWAKAVPAALRHDEPDLPTATWAVLGLMIDLSAKKGSEWQSELSLTEMQRRLGGAGRETVSNATKSLEKHRFVRVDRGWDRKRRQRQTNVYVLDHPQVVTAAARKKKGSSISRTDTSITRACLKKNTTHAIGSMPCSSLQESISSQVLPAEVTANRRNQVSRRRPEVTLPVPAVDDRAARALVRRLVHGPDGSDDHWHIAETLLENEFFGFDRRTWQLARVRHGPRAALAVIETALIVRLRAGTTDPIQSPTAYLSGILRRRPGDCRPEVTLRKLAAKGEIFLDLQSIHTGQRRHSAAARLGSVATGAKGMGRG